jgi:hypothetical protein
VSRVSSTQELNPSLFDDLKDKVRGERGRLAGSMMKIFYSLFYLDRQ